MKLVLLFFFLCLVATLSAKPPRDEQWKNYLKRHGKKHGENKMRRRKWEKNIQFIEKHNDDADKGVHTYKIVDNHLADLVCLGSNLT